MFKYTLTLVGPNGIQGKVPMRMNQKEIATVKEECRCLERGYCTDVIWIKIQ